ncbi:hypothetical protein SAMN05216276_109117 [Streptosporangium subroseum]|uniref:Uncharacterized protein n=1 Tax=Streptosporangium subroseum TaxID=106412 RepID=A0A239P5S6_9ACTN|nr:hypothetical protein [Streptosporangium subroseum]SNT62461.1 hypothetical protein SAMN05216276_109117 [Streptosporangium subroseum]
MTQEPGSEAGSPTAAVLRLGAVLGFGAVLAVSGPVILTTFGVGRQSVGWFCSATTSTFYPPEGPYALESVPGELLFWGLLLLPVVVAGLLLRGSRRATLTAVAAVGAVLAFGLFIAFLLPGLDPCTGQERVTAPPWPLIACYSVAAGALLLAARSPLLRRPLPLRWHGIILWAGAVGAAAWAAAFHRIPVTFTAGRSLTVVYAGAEAPESFWNDLAWWSGTADMIGLPVVLVALAAAIRAAAPARWGRSAGTAAAAVLLLFPLLDVVGYVRWYGDDFQASLIDSVRWHLLLAALLTASAVWGPRQRISRAETVRLARNLIRGPSKDVIPGQAKNLAVAVVIAATAVWLVVSSFTPTR